MARRATATDALTVCYSPRNTTKQAMPTDYTAAVAGLIATCLVLTGMVAFVLSRPSDLEPLSR